jgi:uncharacterized protein (DUF362 family)
MLLPIHYLQTATINDGEDVMKKLTRREFIKTMAGAGVAIGVGSVLPGLIFPRSAFGAQKAVVSIVAIKKDDIDYAVRKAIDLLGGMKTITVGKEKVLLKPNLVSFASSDVTKPTVVKTLAQMMIEAGKDVSIGEGSAAAYQNIRTGHMGGVCRTTDRETLNRLQKSVFDALEYTDLAKTLKVPLVNLHTGEMSKVSMPDNFVFKEINIHKALTDTDLLCSVPMMKTHGLATVTLGMKNLIGVYPGQVYGTVRSAVHLEASKVEPTGTASTIVDIVRANKLGLTVIDGSMAMEGQGPSASGGGRLIKMNIIIAGTNPLATDMVGAYVMGFTPSEILTFVWSWKAGLTPTSLDDVEVRGEKIGDVRKDFARPVVIPYTLMKNYGPPC